MTHAFKFERPVARTFAPPSSLTSPRAAAAMPLSIVQPTPASGANAAHAPVSQADAMIRSVDQAVSRIAGLLQQVTDQQQIIAELSQTNAELQARTDKAEDAATRHELQAGEALLKVEHLQAQTQLHVDEQERLKSSVERLIAMFGGLDAAATIA